MRADLPTSSGDAPAAERVFIPLGAGYKLWRDPTMHICRMEIVDAANLWRGYVTMGSTDALGTFLSALKAAALAPDPAVAGVAGYVLVPVEPTPEMIDAGERAYARKSADMSSVTPTEHPADGGGAFGYGLRAALVAAPTPRAASEGQAEVDDDALTPEQAWDIHINKDDRNSPEEYPEMTLITFGELADYMRRSATPIAPARGAVDLAGVEQRLDLALEAARARGRTGGVTRINAEDAQRTAVLDAVRDLLRPVGEIPKLIYRYGASECCLREKQLASRPEFQKALDLRDTARATLDAAFVALQRDAAIARTSGTGSGTWLDWHAPTDEDKAQWAVFARGGLIRWTFGAWHSLMLTGETRARPLQWEVTEVARVPGLDEAISRARISDEDRDRPACGATGREGV